MAMIFCEPGGDADFGVGLWTTIINTPATATDFVHGGHLKSIKYRVSVSDQVEANGLGNSGRFSFYLYLNALPHISPSVPVLFNIGSNASTVFALNITTTGVLQFMNNSAVQLGSDGSIAVNTGIWYRICIAWNITSTTVYDLRCFVNKATSVSVTNGTALATIGVANVLLGNSQTDTTLDMRTSDHYIDDSNTLIDTNDIWVTAKRPYFNGASNQWTTQIGAGGSGYGIGHSPQVNERPNSDTNGWSIQSATKQTEQYIAEGISQGDINLSSATIVDYMGWVRAKVGVNSTGNIIVANTASNIAVTTTTTFFKKVAGSSDYSVGGVSIGMDTNTVNQLFSLYEAGITVAYIPLSFPSPIYYVGNRLPQPNITTSVIMV